MKSLSGNSNCTLVMTLILTGVVAGLMSCAGEPPQIRRVFWQLNAVEDRDTSERYESLSLFLLVDDADGIEDIDLLYLLNDDDELFWTLTSDGWHTYEEAGETWVGSNKIVMHGSEVFPRGRYRVLVVDKAGERDRERVYVSTTRLDLKTLEFPNAQLSGGVIELSGEARTHTLRFYDDADEVVKIFSTDARRIPVSSVLNGAELQRATKVFVYTYDNEHGAGLVVGPYHLR